MQALQEKLLAYAAYHQDPRNKFTHFLGVPLVAFAVFIPLGWFRLHQAPELPLTGASLFFFAVFIYYCRLDWIIALTLLPFALSILWLADIVSRLPMAQSALIWAAAFTIGWAIQLIGHGLEGRRPALVDNFLQTLTAPVFLCAEFLAFLGVRRFAATGDGELASSAEQLVAQQQEVA